MELTKNAKMARISAENEDKPKKEIAKFAGSDKNVYLCARKTGECDEFRTIPPRIAQVLTH